MSCYTRRATLKSGSLLAVGSLSGCLSGSNEEPSCEDASAILVRQTRVVRVTVPFDQPDATFAVEDALEDRDYTTTVTVDYAQGSPDTRTIEILGQIEREELQRIVDEHGLTVQSIQSETTGNSAFTDIDGSFRWPWDTPLLVDRVEEYQTAAQRLSIPIPILSTTKTGISILETKDESLQSAIDSVRTALTPSGRIAVRFQSSDIAASNKRDYHFESTFGQENFVTRQIEYQSQGQQYEVMAQVQDNRYIKSLFGPTFQTKLPDSIADGEMVIRMDGKIIQRRSPTELEMAYFDWYSENTGEPTHLDDVPITISGRTARGAIRIGSSLAVPTGSINIFRRKC